MEDLYHGRCIRTFTGKYVDVFEPEPGMFCIEDVAHALSQMPRFGGHLKYFYSVGAHSLMCSAEADFRQLGEQAMLNLLMHDASEAYLMDLPRPIKRGIIGYKELEEELMKVMSTVFGFQYPLPDYVKEIDMYLLELEFAKLMMLQTTFRNGPLPMEEIERDFVNSYYALTKSKA